MVKKTAVKLLGAGAVVLGVVLMVGSTWATNMFTTGSTSTAINGSARTIQGTVGSFLSNNDPWVAELWAPAGRCLRIAVTAQGTDLETVVRAPNGQVFRNDDQGGAVCPLCPLVKIANTPNRGWYAVSINHFAGTAVAADFTLQYQHYPVGNVNCAGATIPVVASDEAVKLQKNPAAEIQQQGEEGGPTGQ
ncbi:MAG: hypothetical protein AABY61_00315 [Nitrospirota bacterium]